MSNPAFLVEGHLEKIFVQKVCQNKVVRLLQCNGDDVALQAIVDRVVTHCKIFHGKYYPIVIVLDREERVISSCQMAIQIISLVRAAGINDDLIVAIADRAIENWIIADPEVVTGIYPKCTSFLVGATDGFDGKAKLRQAIPDYHETTVGVELLLRCRPSIMRSSPSFDHFFQQSINLDCQWLQK